MVQAGRKPRPDVVHRPDSFVWARDITTWSDMDLVRLIYYTSLVGSDGDVAEVTRLISTTMFVTRAGGFEGRAQIIPRVHKRLKNSRKSKVVDVDITIDVMRAVLQMPIEGFYLLTGDGDYLALVREIARTTSKQVYLGAFSSGLAEPLKYNVEAFIDLDPIFFTG